MAMTQKQYEKQLKAIKDDTYLTEEDKAKQTSQLQDAYYSVSPVNLGEFEQLLSKLEASKIKQLGEKSREGRKDIFATGLAGMMSNF